MNKPILIVEDDMDIRQTLETFLELKGYRVVACTDGREAMDQLGSGLAPCLILLDLMMPSMDGWEFRSRQLSDPDLAGIPVVVLTGAHCTPEDAESLQALDIITKPVDIPRMLAHVANYAC